MKNARSIPNMFGLTARRVSLQLGTLCLIGSAIVLGNHTSESVPFAAYTHSNSAAQRTLNITLRDSSSGQFISTDFTLRDDQGTSSRATTDKAGRSRFQLAPGERRVELQVPGYKPLQTSFGNESLAQLNFTFWLDPNEPPAELKAETVRANIKVGFAFLHGHVFDVDTGQPLSGVQVQLKRTDKVARTNDRGYFSMSAPAAVPNANANPPSDNLVAEKPGYGTYRRNNLLLVQGATHFIIDMKQGREAIEIDDTHKLLQDKPGEQAALTQDGNGLKGPPVEMTAQGLVKVPPSIRVGSKCSSSGCEIVNTYSLETYVKNGLDDEWMAGWDSDALKAGAIAYRSYGVYHVYNPKSASYDICNTTRCQVNDPTDTQTATDGATDATRGVILTDSSKQKPFFAEYSAENNSAFCPDGQIGSPARNWPCMADSTCVGKTHEGHGRGMCQKGTQRWAKQNKNYEWIVNHYYNNHGQPSGARSGVLQQP